MCRNFSTNLTLLFAVVYLSSLFFVSAQDTVSVDVDGCQLSGDCNEQLKELQSRLATLEAAADNNSRTCCSGNAQDAAATVDDDYHQMSNFTDELGEIRIRLAKLEAADESGMTRGGNACPSDFIFVPSVNGCYKVLTRNMDWRSAGMKCRELHRDAHLVIVDNEAEQRAIVSTAGHHFNDSSLPMCSKPYGNFILLWTAGQRVNPAANTTFVWKVLSADGTRTTVSHMPYTNWPQGEPSYSGSAESCVQLCSNNQYVWNDARCSLSICSLCEIDIAG